LSVYANAIHSVGAGFVPAAFSPIAKDLKVTKQQASYLTTSYTLLGGLTPLLITPFSNVYGRKPMYIVSTGISRCLALHYHSRL
jgi:MFS family permease